MEIIKRISREVESFLKSPQADRKKILNQMTQNQSDLVRIISESKDKKFINKLEHLLVKVMLIRSDMARKLSMPELSHKLADEALELAIKINDQNSRAEAIYDKAIHYNYLSDYNMSQECLKQSLEIFKKLNNIEGIARCYMGIGNNLNSIGNLKKSLSLFNKAIAILDEDNPAHKLILGMICINAGNSLQRLGKTQSAIDHLEKAKKLFIEIKQENSIQILYNNLGYIYSEKGEIEKALKNLNIAIEKSKKMGDNYILGSAYGNLGLVYKLFGEYDKSLEYFFKNIKLKEEFGDLMGLSTGYMNIGIIYQQMRQVGEAIKYYKKALKIKSGIADANGLAECLINLAFASESQKKYDATEKYTLRALKIAERAENRRIIAYCYNLFARLYSNNNQLAKAFEYCEKAIKLSYEIELEMFGMENEVLLGSLYIKNKDYKKAEKLLTRIMVDCDRVKNFAMKAELIKMLSDIYYETKNYKKAYEYSLKQIEEKEKIFNETSNRNVKQLRILFDIERTEKEKELYRLKNVELKQALDELSELHHELIERDKQKTEFLSIASHDLRNPLSAIIGLSNYIIEDESISKNEVNDYMKDIIVSANSMLSIVKNFLNLDAIESKKFKMYPEEFNLTILLDFCITKLINDIKSKQLVIHKNFSHDTILVNYDKSLVLQILDNLISNAIKFSPAGKNLYISLIKNNGKAIFSVKDEGPGLTVEDKSKIFQRFSTLSAKPTAGEHSMGLGLSIVKRLAGLIKTKVSVNSVQGEGAEFNVEFKTIPQK